MIEVVAETGSTNTDLLRRFGVGEAVLENRWLVADRQLTGRGRQGRVWCDDVGNFMGSTLVHLRAGDLPAQTLSLVAGIAVFNAVQLVASNLPGLTLKWPNDLLVCDAKLAGILLERSDSAVVVGIGVNLAQAPVVPDRVVTCLAECGYPVNRDAFAEGLGASWTDALQSWRSGGWEQLRADWTARAHPYGTALKVHGPAGEHLRGTFAGLDADGALQLALPGGTRRTIHAGEIDLDHRR